MKNGKNLIVYTAVLFSLCISLTSNLNLFATQVAHNEVIYMEWISVVQSAYDEVDVQSENIYDHISERFFEKYQRTENRFYLNYALHEGGQAQRNRIVERLSEQEVESIQEIIQKLDHKLLHDDYFELRNFSPSDIYTFLRIDITPDQEEKARQLLQHWADRISVTHSRNNVAGIFKAQALIHGYFLLNEDHSVNRYAEYLVNDQVIPISYFSLDLFNRIAFSARITGYYMQALDIYQNILLPTAEELGPRNRYLSIKMDYTNTLFRIGNVNNYLAEYESIYSELEHLTDPRYRSALFNNLAISYLHTGRFDQYVEFLLNAYDIAQEEDNYSQQITILRNLFIFYRRQSNPDLASGYLNEALQIAHEKELTADVASILLSLGVYKRNIEENPETALDHFFEALEFADQSSNYHHYYNSHLEIAETYVLLDDFENAKNYFGQAIELSQSRDDERGYIQANVRLANAYVKQEKFDDARVFIAQFTDRDFLQLTFDTRVMAHNVLLTIKLEDGQTRDAVQLSEPMIVEIVNWLKESSDQQTGHMRMDPEFTEAFRLHMSVMEKTGDYHKALSALGELRNISRSGFYNNPLLKSNILTEEELITDYNLSSRIQQLRSRYANASDDQRVYLGNELLNAISERNNLLNRAFPNYEETSYDSIFSTLRSQLRNDQMIFYFSIFGDQIFRFSITRRGIDLKAFPNQPDYINILDKAVATLNYGSTDLTLMHNVYKTFFEDAIPGRMNHIFFIPDGQFYRLPIEILPVTAPGSANSYGSTRYLLENHAISYANTLSDLLKDSQSHPDDTSFEYDMAGFGISNFEEAGHPSLPDLPFSASEIVESSDRLDQFTNKQFFINHESTESNFRKMAGKARFLHLATHSKVDDDNPLFSSLYLFREHQDNNSTNEQNTTNDGIIYAYELFDMNLNADLVFLSSCESGSGGYLQGAGVLGFSRAFSYAGAKSLSINLWPIRDQAAADISLRFYDAINQGKNKAEAMRDAQLYYLNNVNSDPYLWGSFVIYGDIQSPFFSEEASKLNYILAGIFIIGFMIIMVLLYQKRLFSGFGERFVAALAKP